MSKVVFKNQVNFLGGNIEYVNRFTIWISKEHKVLTVQDQFGIPCIWTFGEADSMIEERHFLLVGTGAKFEIEEELNYIGTFQLQGGAYIGHLFEVIPEQINE